MHLVGIFDVSGFEGITADVLIPSKEHHASHAAEGDHDKQTRDVQQQRPVYRQK